MNKIVEKVIERLVSKQYNYVVIEADINGIRFIVDGLEHISSEEQKALEEWLEEVRGTKIIKEKFLEE